uniref:RRM domain-containing protein n=1 Tax=Timspurckia oligopyrenoides TaxID=708627 RepID=A0A7S0ZAS5_9RHOD|mmetsp:Transcript_10496/g.18932  ORF Transcript_10496/g.18932 Transcript_10496/m.18932 type:complete len:215 (+) Transcript_10496:84-728(+)
MESNGSGVVAEVGMKRSLPEESEKVEGEREEEKVKKPHKSEEVQGKGEEEEVDAELAAMKQRLKEMEMEAMKLSELQNGSGANDGNGGESTKLNQDSQETIDAKSVYVGNVDYGATPEELQIHFQDCGTVNRVTILCNKFTGHPKGFAYIEFSDEDAVKNATILNDSMFRGRALKVTPKRTNVPGMGDFRGRGRGRSSRGRFTRGGYRGRYAPY